MSALPARPTRNPRRSSAPGRVFQQRFEAAKQFGFRPPCFGHPAAISRATSPIKARRQRPQHMGFRKMPPGELGENLLHRGAHLRRAAYHRPRARTRRIPSDGSVSSSISVAMVTTQPCVPGEMESMNIAGRHIDGLHGREAWTRPSSVASPPPRSISSTWCSRAWRCTASIQSAHRARRDGLAMHDVRQVAGLAEQIVDPDCRGGPRASMFEFTRQRRSLHRFPVTGSDNVSE